MKNLVAKHAHKFNRSSVEVDRKKEEKRKKKTKHKGKDYD